MIFYLNLESKNHLKSVNWTHQFICSVCLCIFPPAIAQVLPPTPGSILQQTRPPAALPAAPGVVLDLPAPTVQAGQAAVPIAVQRIQIRGATLLPAEALAELVQDLVGQTKTLGEINEAVLRITRYYREQGHALAYAYLPAQTIRNGEISIAIVEPRYDQIYVEGSTRFKNHQALDTLGVKIGSPVLQDPLNRGLLLLNQTPGIQVNGTLLPGAQPATTNLKLDVTDTPLAQASVNFDNYGSQSTGQTRALLDVSLDNPFGYGSQLAVNGITTEGGLLQTMGVNYLTPDLRDGLRFSVYGSQTNYRLGGAFASLGQSGSAQQRGVALSYPLVLTPDRVLNVRLDALQNRFEAIGSSTENRSHTDLLRLGFSGAVADAGSGGITSAGLTLTSGRLTPDSAQAQQTDASGPNAAGQFWVIQGQIQRDQPLAKLLPQLLPKLRLQASLGGQTANKNLDSSQKYYLGGPYGVMSAPNSDLGGDSGWLLRLRLAHPVPLPAQAPGNLEVGVLLQSGAIWINRASFVGAAPDNYQRLSAGGIELVYQWSTRVRAQVAYLQRLGDAPSSGTKQREAVWASLRVNF